jgi:hypothetical protein
MRAIFETRSILVSLQSEEFLSRFDTGDERLRRKEEGASIKEMRGSLHCAADNETVRRFGRDDDCLAGCGEETKQIPAG